MGFALFFFFFNWKNGVLGTRIGNGSGKYHGLENGIYTYIYLKALIRHMLFLIFIFFSVIFSAPSNIILVWQNGILN